MRGVIDMSHGGNFVASMWRRATRPRRSQANHASSSRALGRRSERFPVLGCRVGLDGRFRSARVCQNTSITQSPEAEFHTILKPGGQVATVQELGPTVANWLVPTADRDPGVPFNSRGDRPYGAGEWAPAAATVIWDAVPARTSSVDFAWRSVKRKPRW